MTSRSAKQPTDTAPSSRPGSAIRWLGAALAAVGVLLFLAEAIHATARGFGAGDAAVLLLGLIVAVGGTGVWIAIVRILREDEAAEQPRHGTEEPPGLTSGERGW
jgi:hypothetical protein